MTMEGRSWNRIWFIPKAFKEKLSVCVLAFGGLLAIFVVLHLEEAAFWSLPSGSHIVLPVWVPLLLFLVWDRIRLSGIHYASQGDLRLMAILSQSPECREHRHELPYLPYMSSFTGHGLRTHTASWQSHAAALFSGKVPFCGGGSQNPVHVAVLHSSVREAWSLPHILKVT